MQSPRLTADSAEKGAFSNEASWPLRACQNQRRQAHPAPRQGPESPHATIGLLAAACQEPRFLTLLSQVLRSAGERAAAALRSGLHGLQGRLNPPCTWSQASGGDCALHVCLPRRRACSRRRATGSALHWQQILPDVRTPSCIVHAAPQAHHEHCCEVTPSAVQHAAPLTRTAMHCSACSSRGLCSTSGIVTPSSW